MCRRDILPKDIQAQMDGVFSVGAENGLVALTLSVATIGDDLNILSGVNFTIRRNGKYLHETATQSSLPGTLQSDLCALALRLMEDRGIVDVLAEIDPHLLVFPENSTRSLTFFQGCAIAYPDDPSTIIHSIAKELRHAPDLVKNRAQGCTMILNVPASQHDRISQGTKVIQAFNHWQEMTGVKAGGAKANGAKADTILDRAGIKMKSPDQGDIFSCMADCISKDVSAK
jgi:hypothetical protein